MFYQLPNDIIKLIYEYDDTYKIKFNKVIKDIITYNNYKQKILQYYRAMELSIEIYKGKEKIESYMYFYSEYINLLKEISLLTINKYSK